MKQFTILSTFFFLVSCKSTFIIVEQPTAYSTVIKKSRVTAVIFNENGDCFPCFQSIERFTPTIIDIEKAERILNENLKTVNESRMNQVDNCPIIHKNLKYYRRQYFGYIDGVGNKIIYTTFNWDKQPFAFKLLESYDKVFDQYEPKNENWKKEEEAVMDGCSYHWKVKINLDTGKLFDLEINGIG